MGRTSILMVMGFSILVMTVGSHMSRISLDAYKNYVSYYNRNTAYQIATSAANMAASQITFTPNWRVGYDHISFNGGRYDVHVDDLDSGRIAVEVEADYNGESKHIKLTLGLTKFSKFSYYSNIEGAIYWTTGDTVWGPLHTQQKINVAGNPVFFGRVTAKNGISLNPSSSKPKFLGGYQTGVNIDLPADLTDIKNLASTGGKYFTGKDIYLEFNSNGTVTYRDGSWTATPTTVAITTLAPNGVLCADNGNLHIKGKLNGRLTISALGSSGLAKGNVYVDSSVVYNRDPLTTTSTDMLGIVCDNNVIITDNTNNNNAAKGVNLHATMLCRSGGLTAQNYNTRGLAGKLNVLGGVQQYQRGPVGTLSGTTLSSGFQKNYRYDNRLMVDSPPLYPTTGTYEVLSWYE